MKPPVRAHTRQAPSNSSNNKMSKNTDIKFMWSFCSDEGYSIQRTPLWQYNFHFYSPTCSLSINMLRFIGQIYNYARLKSYIKAKCCVFFLLLLHTQSSVFSKCVHSENKSSRAAMSYISEPIGWQPVLRCGEGYSEWRRGERKWSKQKWKKKGGWGNNYVTETYTHTHLQPHTHTQVHIRPCLRWRKLDAALRSRAASSRSQPRDPASSLPVSPRVFLWPHRNQKPLAQLAKALYLAHNYFCSPPDTERVRIVQCQRRSWQTSTWCITLFIWQSQALWDNICLPHTHTHTHARTKPTSSLSHTRAHTHTFIHSPG